MRMMTFISLIFTFWLNLFIQFVNISKFVGDLNQWILTFLWILVTCFYVWQGSSSMLTVPSVTSPVTFHTISFHLNTYFIKWLHVTFQTWGRPDCRSPLLQQSWWPCPPLTSSSGRCSGWRRCFCSDTRILPSSFWILENVSILFMTYEIPRNPSRNSFLSFFLFLFAFT